MESQAWRFATWLSMYPLDPSSVLDYFKHSPFYDRSCNNELLELQSAGLDPAQRTVQLHGMTGLEYELDLSSRYLIRKQYRRSPTEVNVHSVYYIVGAGVGVGTVYMLPSVHTVLSSQISSAAHYLEQAVTVLSTQIEYNPVQYYSWKKIKQQEEEEEEEIHRYSRLVDDVLRTTTSTTLQ
jgi:mediator of RNA polymerase II transcription subunit 6